jgi:hypothetical protein
MANDLDALLDALADRVAERIASRIALPVASPPPAAPTRTTAREWMDTRAAAEHLGMTPRALEAWRERGTGPKFHRVASRVRYRRSDLDAYAEGRTK